MILAHVAAESPPQAGDALFGGDLDGQASGMVVNAQAAPEQGYDLLAVVQSASVAQGALHFNSPNGPILNIEPLPYPLA